MASGHIQKEGLEPAWQGKFVVSGYTELGCCPENCSHTVYRRLDGGETEEEKEVVTVGTGEITRSDCPHLRAQSLRLLACSVPGTPPWLDTRKPVSQPRGIYEFNRSKSSPSFCLVFRHCTRPRRACHLLPHEVKNSIV